jgi:hypothetical protein
MESVLRHYKHVFFDISRTHRIKDKWVVIFQVICLQEMSSVDRGRGRDCGRRPNNLMSLTMCINNEGLVAQLDNTSGHALGSMGFVFILFASFSIAGLLEWYLPLL